MSCLIQKTLLKLNFFFKCIKKTKCIKWMMGRFYIWSGWQNPSLSFHTEPFLLREQALIVGNGFSWSLQMKVDCSQPDAHANGRNHEGQCGFCRRRTWKTVCKWNASVPDGMSRLAMGTLSPRRVCRMPVNGSLMAFSSVSGPRTASTTTLYASLSSCTFKKKTSKRCFRLFLIISATKKSVTSPDFICSKDAR